MSLSIHTKSIKISEDTEDYIEKKTNKFTRFLSNIEETRVDITQEQTKSDQDRIIAEITVRANRKILRAEERSGDVMTAIDRAAEKLNRQIVRLKGKRDDRRHSYHDSLRNDTFPEISADVLEALAEEDGRRIVRVKQFSVVPMNEDEAIEQMQLLSHDFFVFYNADVGRINVLYKREDDNYGLLDPMVA